MKRFLLLLIFVPLAACGKTLNSQTITFQVYKGDNIGSVSRRMSADRIISSDKGLQLAARLYRKPLKRGNYEIPPQISYKELLAILSSGRSVNVKVTFPEGFTSFDIAKTLEENNICSSNDFIKEISKEEYLQRYAIPKDSAQSLEGYLFPDTYYFSPETPASTVAQAMLARFDSVITELRVPRSNLHSLLSLAAIVQKETGGKKTEMRLVSGVYTRRMKIGMRLQADPTLIYALILDGEYTGNIRTKHLQPPYPHPYNTYFTQGLPPGPIASPGKDAIAAAIAPEDTSYLYFVGKGDGTGTHQFSKNLVDHNAAVRKYQLGK